MRPHPQPTPTPVASLPLPKGWRKATLIMGSRRYPFIYNPRTRRVHAPGFPQLPLNSIHLHADRIIANRHKGVESPLPLNKPPRIRHLLLA